MGTVSYTHLAAGSHGSAGGNGGSDSKRLYGKARYDIYGKTGGHERASGRGTVGFRMDPLGRNCGGCGSSDHFDYNGYCSKKE